MEQGGDGLRRVGLDRVVAPAPLLAATDEAAGAEHLHVMGKRRLLDAKSVEQLAGADFAALAQGTHNGEAVLIAQRLKHLKHVVIHPHHTPLRSSLS